MNNHTRKALRYIVDWFLVEQKGRLGLSPEMSNSGWVFHLEDNMRHSISNNEPLGEELELIDIEKVDWSYLAFILEEDRD